MLPDRSVLIGQKLVENAKMPKFKCEILSNFQTMCSDDDDDAVSENQSKCLILSLQVTLVKSTSLSTAIFGAKIQMNTFCVIFKHCGQWSRPHFFHKVF